jgi:Tfp pilus assembly protein PilV
MIRNKDAGNFFQIRENKEDGFTLVEVIIALVILMISVMGIFAVFTYATVYNTGNSMRSQALSILQQEVEKIRSAKFTPTITDNYTPGTPDDGRRDLRGGTKPTRPATALNGTTYTVQTIVDNDPFATGVQTETDVPNPKLKEITITVTPQSSTPGSWVVANPIRVVFRRVRAN